MIDHVLAYLHQILRCDCFVPDQQVDLSTIADIERFVKREWPHIEGKAEGHSVLELLHVGGVKGYCRLEMWLVIFTLELQTVQYSARYDIEVAASVQFDLDWMPDPVGLAWRCGYANRASPEKSIICGNLKITSV